MKTNRRIAFFVSIATLSLAGCSHQPSKPAAIQPTESPTARTADASKPQSDGQNFNAPDALARKTAEYSKEMQSLSEPEKQSGAKVAEQSRQELNDRTTAQGKQSNVKWGEPFDLSVNSATISQQQGGLEPKSIDDTAKPASSVAMESSPVSANPALSGMDKNAGGANSSAAIRAPEPTPVAIAPPITIGSSAELAPKLEKRVKEYPRDLSAQLDFQLLRFLMDDRVPDLAALSSLPTEDREVISTIVDGLMNFRSAVRQDNNMLLSRKVRPLIEMADRLRGQADLTVPVVALCTSVRTFGEYDPIDPARFAAGKAHDVILYSEVENFSSQLDDKQMWQTKLTQEAVLYTESGMEVWSDKSEPINDLARHRRHDFFIVKKIRIPANLAVGRYLMKITIVDQQMSRVAEATVPIIIAVQ